MLSFEVAFLGVLALVWIVFATVQDLRSREVANWLNFSLIIFALGFRFFFSLFNDNFIFFYQGLIGLGIFFILGNLFYYSRVFAGGDAKLMIALGAVLPFYYDIFSNLKIFVSFLFVFFFVGAIYGLFVSVFLAVRNFKKFRREASKQFRKKKIFILIFLFAGLSIFSFGFFEEVFFILGGFVFILPYFYLYAKAIDNACMVKDVLVGKLREGDWLYNDVRVGTKLVKASWDGLSKEDIKRIKMKYKKVKIRHGIAFVPVFLISYLVLLGLVYFGFFEKMINSFLL